VTTPHLIELPDGTYVTPDDKATHLDLPEESWCIGCALVEDTGFRFTREQAATVGEWVLCADCEDTFNLTAEQIIPVT
jgi:hypothetical protein